MKLTTYYNFNLEDKHIEKAFITLLQDVFRFGMLYPDGILSDIKIDDQNKVLTLEIEVPKYKLGKDKNV